MADVLLAGREVGGLRFHRFVGQRYHSKAPEVCGIPKFGSMFVGERGNDWYHLGRWFAR